MARWVGNGPCGWRGATARILANALLTLLAFEAVFIAAVAERIAADPATLPMTPVDLVLYGVAFYLIRWLVLLPGLLPLLIGIELVARRAPQPRLLTAVVAFAPMVWWELAQSSGDVPSTTGALLGVTAVLFAVLARLPARSPGRSMDHTGAPGRSVAPVVVRR